MDGGGTGRALARAGQAHGPLNSVGLYVEGSPIREIFGRPLDELAGDLFADPDFPLAVLMRELAKLDKDPSAIPFESPAARCYRHRRSPRSSDGIRTSTARSSAAGSAG